MSSAGESHYALEDPRPPRIAFDLRRVMRTRYRIDAFQSHYFVIESFEDLLRQTVDADFGPLYESLRELPELDATVLLDTDKLEPLRS